LLPIAGPLAATSVLFNLPKEIEMADLFSALQGAAGAVTGQTPIMSFVAGTIGLGNQNGNNGLANNIVKGLVDFFSNAFGQTKTNAMPGDSGKTDVATKKSDELNKQIEDSREQIADLKARITQMEQALDKLSGKHNPAAKPSDEMPNDADRPGANRQRNLDALLNMAQEIGKLKEELEQAEKTLDAQKQELQDYETEREDKYGNPGNNPTILSFLAITNRSPQAQNG
jgi:uncharacterized coiled-coil DUF342 family protein